MNDNASCEKLFLGLKREFTFKYVIIGDFGVGKTSIVNRYSNDTFSNRYKITIGADFLMKTINWDENTEINLQLWDISGYERFGSLTSVYYKFALGAIVVFDLTRPETYASTEKWIKDVRKWVTLSNGKDIPILLFANKGEITTDTIPNDIDEFCKRNDVLAWFITSAKENINLDKAMDTLIKATLFNQTQENGNETPPIKLTATEFTKKTKRFCFF